MVLKDILTRQGYTVLTAPSAESAIDMSEETGGGFQLLLTRVDMEEMPGVELAARLRANYPHVKVLFNCDRLDAEVAQLLTTRRNYFFILKPFEESALLEKVHIVFAGWGNEAAE